MDAGQEAAGGPREGRGGAVRAAIWAAAMGCRACSSAEGLMERELECEGGDATEAHSGQSIVADTFTSPPSPSTSTIFIPPPAEQTICMLPGLITVEATAEPRNSANQASTRPTISLELRRVCMRKLSHRYFDRPVLTCGRAAAEVQFGHLPYSVSSCASSR